MTVKTKGLYYAPSPPPQGIDPKVGQYLAREFGRIADNLHEGRSQTLRMDVLEKLPDKPHSGLVCWFPAGLAGATEGLYEYRGTAWQKL